ncbi:hypothetical protein ACT2CR_00600 [Candidatus Vidania fulgoroideorum]
MINFKIIKKLFNSIINFKKYNNKFIFQTTNIVNKNIIKKIFFYIYNIKNIKLNLTKKNNEKHFYISIKKI